MSVLKDILSISGQSGLYKFVSQGRNGIIVENIEDSKRLHASSSNKISSLDDIAVFTADKDMPLKEVFQSISNYLKENNLPDSKMEDKALKTFFSAALPNYDRDRVYVSDIRKIIRWFNILSKANMLNFDATEETEDSEESVKANA